MLLNYNGEEDTIECLESLKNINYGNFNVVLVDNSSEESSVESIISFLDGDEFYRHEVLTSNKLSGYRLDENINLLFVLNDVNSGFAGGNNVALNYIMNEDFCDYALLLNNDTVVSRDFLDSLVCTSKEFDDGCFVGMTHYYYHDRNQIQTVGGGVVDLLHGEASSVTDRNYDGRLDFLTGSCILIHTDVLRDVGVLNEDYFMYWEDVDWSAALIEHGYKPRISAKGCIYHKEGSSIKSLNRIYYHTRNRILYMSRHTTGLMYSKFMIYIVLYVMKESLTNIIKRGKYSQALIKGLKDGIKLAYKDLRR